MTSSGPILGAGFSMLRLAAVSADPTATPQTARAILPPASPPHSALSPARRNGSARAVSSSSAALLRSVILEVPLRSPHSLLTRS